MSNSQLKTKAFYRKTMNILQKLFAESATQNQIADRFKSQVLKEFRLCITFDDMMSQALKDYTKEIIENFIQSESFTNKINFLDKINALMYQIRYISSKAYGKLNQSIKKAKVSYDNAWQEGLVYLRNSPTLDEFRWQFLVRYCEVSQKQAEQLLQDVDSNQEHLQKLKNYYEDFFKRKCWEANVRMKLLTFIEDYFSRFQNKSQMLSPETLKNLEKKLGGAVGATQQQIHLNNMLVEIAQQNSYNNDQQIQQKLQNQIKNIEKALKKFSGLNLIKQKGIVLRLGKFGSLTSGFAGTDADLDLTILTNSYVNQTEFLKLLLQFLRKQYKEQDRRGGRRIALEIVHAKIPLIQIKIYDRGQRQPLKIDLIVNNILGVINSKFLKVYSKIKWIKNLGLLVKLWGKSVELIHKNALSSYAMILMLIHYLIKVKKVKAILDHRVITNQTPYFQYKRLKLNQIQQFRVYFSFKTQQNYITSYERINYLQVLKGFMQYYGYEIWKLKQADRIITVDLSNDRQIDKECAITIKDPFDKPHNPGRLKIESQQFFKQKFKDAYTILQKGQETRIQSLFKK